MKSGSAIDRISHPGLGAGGNGLTRSSMALCYHKITTSESRYLYSTTSAQLAKHFELVSELAEKTGPVPRLTVTFDDGHISTYRNGLPLLQRYFVFATFFVTASWIGTAEEALGWEQVRELARLGHTIGSHGWSHAFLTRCSDSDLEMELTRSKQTLEDKLGTAVDSISFPGGRWNSRVLRASSGAGYRQAYCSDPWIAPQLREGLELRGRLMVRNNTDCAQLLRLSTPGSASLLSMRARGMAQQAARTLLGDDLYLSLWRKLANSGKYDKTP